MQSVGRAAAFYPILLGLAGGGLGAVLGWGAGCQLNIGDGEDPGLDGCILGGTLGAVGGIATGVVVGSTLAKKSRRAEAIRRIRVRRIQRDPSPQ